MVREPSSRDQRVLAVLGPTNTGKTHFAVERMLAHRSGMMGFPLRLLAREVFDRVVALRGRHAVALITGEERQGRDDAAYLICTTEAMPLHRETAFLAVDEIQLCADLERGHVFTDRLLNARGSEETMFLGSDTIRPILKRLVPEAEIITRPRFSILTHAGETKLVRLPRRSAIVAFTASEVYSLAEAMRRQKGGVAVVMGALSPRTRNAQVALYQAGEVDHLVATDAIGMGLNMDLAHVAFASLHKFDGREQRRLTAAEMAQIAGRAGRHMANGTFGTTGSSEAFEEREIAAIEGHSFPPLKSLRWRNSVLDFSSLKDLIGSLNRPPPVDCLVRVRDALDDRSLAFLGRRQEIRARADRADRVRLLWQVCQIPDFRKTLNEAHLHLLATVYGHLTTGRCRLPNDWVGGMIARLDRTEGDIDALVARISHVRTWTYMSHRAEWLDDAVRWQDRAREVEDRLSDALHERLTQRFVDRRAAALMRSLREQGDNAARVEPSGEVLVDELKVGRLEGLGFVLEGGEPEVEQRLLMSTARRAVGPALRARAQALLAEADQAFSFTANDGVLWRDAILARLRPGPRLMRPRVVLEADPMLESRAGKAVRERVETWLDRWLHQRLAVLVELERLSGEGALGAPARAIAFRLVEGLGCIEREGVAELMAALSPNDRMALTRADVRFGWHHLYAPTLLKPAAVEARARLCRIGWSLDLTMPEPGRTVLRGEDVPPVTAALALGFVDLGGFALRVDLLERIAARVRAEARQESPFTLPPEFGSETGLSREELLRLVEALDFKAVKGEAGLVFARPSRRQTERRRKDAAERKQRAMAGPASSPFAVLARLKTAT